MTAPSRSPGRPGLAHGAVDVVVQVVHRVLVDPVRSGRLRGDGWPPGLTAIVTSCLACYVGLAVITVSGPWVRQALPAGSAAFGIASELLGVALAITVLLAAALTTAAMHAPAGVKLAGLAAPVLLWSAMAQLALSVDQLFWCGLGLLALLGFHLLRLGRAFAWWEFVVNLGVIGAVTATNLVTFVRPVLASGRNDRSFLVVLVVMSVGVLGLGYVVTSGAATAEVAFTSSVWLVEYVGRRFPRQVQVGVVGLILVVAWAAQLWRLVRSPLPWWLAGVEVLVASVLVGLTAGCWVLLAGALQRRRQRLGLPPDVPDVGDLSEAFGRLALWVGVALAAPQMANIIWGNLERGLWLPLRALGVRYVPGDLASRLSSGVDAGRWLLLAGELVAVLICVVAMARAYRQAQPAAAQLALITGLFCLFAAARRAGMPLPGLGLDTLGAAMVLISTGTGAFWLVRGRLTVPRGLAIGVALLLSAAVLGRDLVADPIGWLLGASGGALLVFGLVWNLLTGAEEANGDSPSFPRPARVLLIVGYLTVTMLIAATDAVAVSFAVDLDRFVRMGVEVIGTALLATGLWAVLSAASRNRSAI
ncbi:hypothetical protein [Micropruina sp.]|uniref:hypothetical protein n=1 Tax=Micropruina sp. TaxID=2737536 RepID=UPI002631EDA1|nr:hypothetical protein [Micropruina sp.]